MGYVNRIPTRLGILLPLLVCLSWSAPAFAVDGISVTGHWSGTNENLYGGFGQIWRHDIVNSQVTHTLLVDDPGNPARNPVISPDGTRVAFLRQDGSIAVVSIDGGAVTTLDNASSHGQACLDWPAGDWVYYTKGGFSQPSGSKLLHRVNAATGVDEYVTTFKKDDGTTDSGTWRFHIANDLQRAAIRPDDTSPMPAGCITAFDLVNDDRLLTSRSIGSPGNWRCSTGMDPDGTYFMEGNQAHDGILIHRWDDMSTAATIQWTDAVAWGPDTGDTGNSHNRNAWATNSWKWVLIHIGFGNRGTRGANQMLINWFDEERIVVTENTDNSYEFDCAGDFWVGSASPQPATVTGHPQDVTVAPGEQADFTVQATGTPTIDYQWQRDGVDIGGATSPTYSLTAGAGDNGARFLCGVSNAHGSDVSTEATLTVTSDTTPPSLVTATAAGDPTSVRVTFSEPVEVGSAEAAGNYSIDNGISVSSATVQADPAQVDLTTSTLSTGVTYTLSVSNVTDTATPPNPIPPGSTIQFDYTDSNQPPAVDVGQDESVQVDVDLLVGATVNDDGQPGGPLTFLWTQESGPGQATFTTPDETSTYVRFDAEGDYVLRLTADDGALSAWDELTVTVLPPPSITILSPSGGESWDAGSVQSIRWSAQGVTDVRIDYSEDGGQTWTLVEMSIDTGNPAWGDYAWTLPAEPTDQAVIQLTEYSLITSAQSNQFSIVGPEQQLDLLSPSAGETLTGLSDTSIRWTASEVSTVVLEYSLDGGQAWQEISRVDLAAPDWGDHTWTVPNVSSQAAYVRARTPSSSVEDSAGPMTINPTTQAAGELDVTRISFTGQAPRGVTQVEVDGQNFEVAADGTFEAEVLVPTGVTSLVAEVRPAGAGEDATRLIRVELGEVGSPIPGLGVSASELRAFLGGKGGVLVWVDEGGRVQVLDFRGAAPQPVPLSADLDCVNPLISPDGTRVVYSQGSANGPKFIITRDLSGEPNHRFGIGDIAFWAFTGGTEQLIYCDWVDKDDNGAGGATWSQPLLTGEVGPDGDPVQIHDRAMDAGPNADATWLGQVYGVFWAHDLSTGTDYPTGSFYLQDGAPADHQTCNGSMAPDSTARIMALVIPHDYVRIYTHDPATGHFDETSRFLLPGGMVEWEFPEWSTDPDYFTAVLRSADYRNRLFVVKVAEGELVPEVLEITGENGGATYSHLWIEP